MCEILAFIDGGMHGVVVVEKMSWDFYERLSGFCTQNPEVHLANRLCSRVQNPALDTT